MNHIEILSQAILSLCLNSPQFEDEIVCFDYYVNCVVDKAGEWSDTKLIECIKQSKGDK